MVRRLVSFLALSAALGACGPSSQQDSPDASGDQRKDGGTPDASTLHDGGQPPKDGGTSMVRSIVALEVTPDTMKLKVGGVSGLTATATFDDGEQADVTGTVQWMAQPAGILSVEPAAGLDNVMRIEALAQGVAQVTARTGNVFSNASTVTVEKSITTPTDGGTKPTTAEYRAVWVTRFAYNTKTQVEGIIDRAASAGFNVVFFQIRGNGDAYYQSQLSPWAQKLTGTLGQDPGWDPLQTAIDRAHMHGMELHAYWNVFSGWPCGGSGCDCRPEQGKADSCTLPPASPPGMPDHILREHPEYMAVTQQQKNADSEYFWLSPGNPAVRARLLAEADELISAYDIDGLHLDRIRYPGSSYSHDAASLAAYEALPAATRPSYQDWQRDQVSLMVEGLYKLLKQKRPNALLSASVWGIYKPLPGCSTSQGYGNYFQDSIAWMKNGQIDALVPMIYWGIGTGCTDWAKLVDGFLAGSNGRPIIAGMHALDNGSPQLSKMTSRVEYARTVGAAGTAVFASTYLEPKTSGSPTWSEQWTGFRSEEGPYASDAGTPEIDWR